MTVRINPSVLVGDKVTGLELFRRNEMDIVLFDIAYDTDRLHSFLSVSFFSAFSIGKH